MDKVFTVYSHVLGVGGYHDFLAATHGEARINSGAVAGRMRARAPTPNTGNAVKSASSMGSAPPLESFTRLSSYKGVRAVLAAAS